MIIGEEYTTSRRGKNEESRLVVKLSFWRDVTWRERKKVSRRLNPEFTNESNLYTYIQDKGFSEKEGNRFYNSDSSVSVIVEPNRWVFLGLTVHAQADAAYKKLRELVDPEALDNFIMKGELPASQNMQES